MLQNNLNKLLGERNIKLRTVAEETGLAYTTLFGLVKESTSGIQFETLEKICSYFQITPSELFDYSPYSFETRLSQSLSDLDNSTFEFTINAKNGIYDKDFKLEATIQIPQNNPHFPKSNNEDYELYITINLVDSPDYFMEDLFNIIQSLETNFKRKFYQLLLANLIKELNLNTKKKIPLLVYDLESDSDKEMLLTKKKHCIFEIFKDTNYYRLADLELGTDNLLV